MEEKTHSRRYEKFLLEKSEIPVLPDNDKDGLHFIKNNITELEQCEYRNQSRILECLYYTLCELFEIEDITMQTSGFYNSFFLIKKTDGDIESGIASPALSRVKLKNGSSMDVSGAVIDLILNRDKWDRETSGQILHF